MRLGQQMKLAPRMIQSMEILQMPLMELQERIDQELESNIALEQVQPGSEDGAVRDETEVEEPLRERELVAGDEKSDFQRLSEFERNYSESFDSAFSERPYSGSRSSSGERDRKMDAMANTPSRGEGLTEQLLHQLAFMDVSDEVAAAGRLLIQYIDEDGFLSADLPAIVDNHASALNPLNPGAREGRSPQATRRGEVRGNSHLGGSPSPTAPQSKGEWSIQLTLPLLEEALLELQNNLDPPGIAARNQREGLLIQVDRFASDPENQYDWSDVITLIKDHYDDLLQNRLPRIEQKSGLTIDRIRNAMALMKKLNLHPGRDLVEQDVPPIIPDVIVEYEESTDQYVARLADGVLPHLRISDEAEKLAKDKSQAKETREFAQNGIRTASWLIEAIAQRRTTLLRVVNVVLSRQREYFDYGAQHLKPMPMTEVADQLGVHVATVSRAVSDKWVQAPRGMVALRGFFSGGSVTDAGEEVSWQAVKAQLKEIVDAEDKSRPFSDQALTEELKKRGIDLARRTVVKYRQQLDIPPARLRKVH